MRALFSIGVFLMISFSLSLVNLRYIIAGDYKWYNLLIVLLFLPLALVILIRQLASFKIKSKVEDGKIAIIEDVYLT